jgi:hypothetical protein
VKYINCNEKYIGNKNPLPGLSFTLPDVANIIPKSAGCHYHQCYMDGLLTESIVDGDTGDGEQREHDFL